MVLPSIDVASLPNLDAVTGIFGSLLPSGRVDSGDEIIALMVFLYDLLSPF